MFGNPRSKSAPDVGGEPSADKPSEAVNKKRSAATGLTEKMPKKAKASARSEFVADLGQVDGDQRAEAASLLASTTPAVRIPPPDTLLEDEAYGEAALKLFSVSFSF